MNELEEKLKDSEQSCIGECNSSVTSVIIRLLSAALRESAGVVGSTGVGRRADGGVSVVS